jgi:uncharacterized protein YbaP (TraB family)
MEVKSVEAEVNSLAQGKKISDLESVDFQLDMLSQIATPEYFYEHLKLYDEAGELTNKMVQAYKNEDLTGISELINNPKWMSPKMHDLMLTQRNNRWVEIIPTKVADAPTLIAVGAGHLIGEDGLIKLLRDKGYTLTPVIN